MTLNTEYQVSPVPYRGLMFALADNTPQRNFRKVMRSALAQVRGRVPEDFGEQQLRRREVHYVRSVCYDYPRLNICFGDVEAARCVY